MSASPRPAAAMLPALIVAETRKLLSRPLARVGIVLSIGLGAAAPFLLWMAAHSGIQVNESDLGASIDLSAPGALKAAMYLRNLLAAQIVLSVLAAASFAGELQTHTLREDLVRPVPRWAVLAAKWAALCGWSVVSIVGQVAVGTAVGAAFGPTGQAAWSDVLLGYLATAVAEFSVAAVALAASVWIRSVSGAVTGLVLVLLFERLATWAGWGLRSLIAGFGGAVPRVFELLPFTPSSAWSGWAELSVGAPPSWQIWVALVGWTAIAVIVAERRFARMDIL
ncbi:MAG: ABC transporter permease [Myxococcota bacterium]